MATSDRRYDRRRPSLGLPRKQMKRGVDTFPFDPGTEKTVASEGCQMNLGDKLCPQNVPLVLSLETGPNPKK